MSLFLGVFPDFVANPDVDDADTYHGAPVGVQLVGRRLQEEKMLTIAEYIGEEIVRDAGRP